MSAKTWLGRVLDWLAGWLPRADECGVLARTGDVYCSLPEGHEPPHGFER